MTYVFIASPTLDPKDFTISNIYEAQGVVEHFNKIANQECTDWQIASAAFEEEQLDSVVDAWNNDNYVGMMPAFYMKQVVSTKRTA